jgi:hypothetical protein
MVDTLGAILTCQNVNSKSIRGEANFSKWTTMHNPKFGDLNIITSIFGGIIILCIYKENYTRMSS